MFYGGDTKFSYTACQWIEAQAIKTSKHIHHKINGHGGECMVKVWVLNDKGKKEPAFFLVDGYDPETNTVYQFHGCPWHGHTCLKNRTKRQQKRYKDTCQQHPYPSDFQMLSGEVQKQWRQWVNQIPVIGFNSGKYDLNMAKEYFVKDICYNKEDERNEDVFAAKRENNYMFLTTFKFKFLEVKNYVGPGLSYAAWCKLMGCKLQKLMFPYEWLDSYKKVSHVGPVSYEDF